MATLNWLDLHGNDWLDIDGNGWLVLNGNEWLGLHGNLQKQKSALFNAGSANCLHKLF
jgi:hypothetical protein